MKFFKKFAAFSAIAFVLLQFVLFKKVVCFFTDAFGVEMGIFIYVGYIVLCIAVAIWAIDLNED